MANILIHANNLISKSPFYFIILNSKIVNWIITFTNVLVVISYIYFRSKFYNKKLCNYTHATCKLRTKPNHKNFTCTFNTFTDFHTNNIRYTLTLTVMMRYLKYNYNAKLRYCCFDYLTHNHYELILQLTSILLFLCDCILFVYLNVHINNIAYSILHNSNLKSTSINKTIFYTYKNFIINIR